MLTNNHVIDGADEIIVRLYDRRQLVAELIGTDQRSDIALLKLMPTVCLLWQLANRSNLKWGSGYWLLVRHLVLTIR